MATTIQWLGHATVLVNINDTWILTDPVLRRRVGHLWRRYPVLPSDWPTRVDAVLISHAHWDHLDLPTLRRLGRNRRLLVPPHVGSWLGRRGFTNVRELRVGEGARIGSVTVTAVPANHSGWRPPFGPTADAIGYIVNGERRLYFPGDTDLFPEMDSLAGDLDVALIPVWGWGPTLGTGHLDPVRAAEAVRRLQPRIVIPIHWGTFHPIGTARRSTGFLDEPPHVFAQAVRRVAPNTDVRMLAVAEGAVV